MRPRTPDAPAGIAAVGAPAGIAVLLATGLAFGTPAAAAGPAAPTAPTAPTAAAAAAALTEAHGPARFEFVEPHMGTTFRIVLFAGDSAGAAAAARAAFDVVAALDARLSDWDPDSELSRLAGIAGTGEGRAVSPELWHALSLARDWADRTDGAFDPTIGPLTRLWRWSARRGELPDSARLAAARAAVGWRDLRLEPGPDAPDSAVGSVVHLERPGMALDLGGIAKGIAADAALAELARHGIGSALVDAGGDIALGAPPPGEAGWRVAVERRPVGEDPGHGSVEGAREGPGEGSGEALVLANVGVATSGAAFRYFEAGGVRYSHIVDPRTGLGVTDPGAVTVIAPDAATADVLASALSVLNPAAGRALLATVPGARVVGR